MTDQSPTAQSGPSAFRKKPVVIQASQWFKHGDHPAVVLKSDPNRYSDEGVPWCPTLEGGHVVTPGDWIITGVKGEHYPCKPDIFAATYEPATTPPAGARDAVAPDWRNDWLLDLMGEWDTPMPTGMFDAIVERLPKAPQPAATGVGDLPELLADLLEYMNERYDADHDGSSFVANEEMRLGLRIQAALAAQPAPTINSQRIEHMAKNFQIEVFQGEGSYCCIVVVKTMLEATGLAATNLSKGRHLILSRTDEPVTHKTSAAAQAFIDVQLFQLEG